MYTPVGREERWKSRGWKHTPAEGYQELRAKRKRRVRFGEVLNTHIREFDPEEVLRPTRPTRAKDDVDELWDKMMSTKFEDESSSDEEEQGARVLGAPLNDPLLAQWKD